MEQPADVVSVHRRVVRQRVWVGSSAKLIEFLEAAEAALAGLQPAGAPRDPIHVKAETHDGEQELSGPIGAVLGADPRRLQRVEYAGTTFTGPSLGSGSIEVLLGDEDEGPFVATLEGSNDLWVRGTADMVSQYAREGRPGWAWLVSDGGWFVLWMILSAVVGGICAAAIAIAGSLRASQIAGIAFLIPCAAFLGFVVTSIGLRRRLLPRMEILGPADQPRGSRNIRRAGAATLAIATLVGVLLTALGLLATR